MIVLQMSQHWYDSESLTTPLVSEGKNYGVVGVLRMVNQDVLEELEPQGGVVELGHDGAHPHEELRRALVG